MKYISIITLSFSFLLAEDSYCNTSNIDPLSATFSREHYNIGDQVEVSFNLSSREWNGKYFHNIDAWKIEKTGEEETENNNLEEPPVFNTPASEEDDLPF